MSQHLHRANPYDSEAIVGLSLARTFHWNIILAVWLIEYNSIRPVIISELQRSTRRRCLQHFSERRRGMARMPSGDRHRSAGGAPRRAGARCPLMERVGEVHEPHVGAGGGRRPRVRGSFKKFPPTVPLSFFRTRRLFTIVFESASVLGGVRINFRPANVPRIGAGLLFRMFGSVAFALNVKFSTV